MSEAHLGVVESDFLYGSDCPTCRAKITPKEVMEEHAPMCARIALLESRLEAAGKVVEAYRSGDVHCRSYKRIKTGAYIDGDPCGECAECLCSVLDALAAYEKENL